MGLCNVPGISQSGVTFRSFSQPVLGCSEANAGTGHVLCPVTLRHLKPLQVTPDRLLPSPVPCLFISSDERPERGLKDTEIISCDCSVNTGPEIYISFIHDTAMAAAQTARRMRSLKPDGRGPS